ncbi:hypothetical protein [Morococcus cerebrosus]|uniref:Uncharacterized protein n=2 Tax=Neisseriaceae TaxID=481 RepID=A0A0C1E5W3_9NEIS|nr:hypothetical protein [Morococcus cerebrosus]KIC07449.1 hypothetical protein MCC93_13810 [Morococcus cerebrosus]OFJ62165.1 hypothetical protein HMPREF2858_04670 [Neisseria sp. HMSC073B07]UNV87979.1 hypothetical protein MON37_03325 [Morococcus cerebrosus]
MKIRNLYTVIPAQAGIQTLILMFKDWYGFKTLDSRLRGNDGVGIAILICFGRQVSDDLLSYGLTADYRIVG